MFKENFSQHLDEVNTYHNNAEAYTEINIRSVNYIIKL
jgi:hypothetical protein